MKKLITIKNLMHLAFILAIYLFISWINDFFLISNSSDNATAALIKTYDYILFIKDPFTEMNILWIASYH